MAVIVVAAGACGAAEPAPTGPGAQAVTDGCGPRDGRAAAEVTVAWHGPWDTTGGPRLIGGWDADHAEVDVELAEPVEADTNVPGLLGDDPPTVARVPMEAVEVLAAAGAIRPFEGCAAIGTPGPGTVAAARGIGEFGNRRWAVAPNVDAGFLLYDRAALRRAGLPDRAPVTWHELLDAARQLRTRLGMSTPVAGLSPSMVLAGSPLTPAVPAAARPYLDLLAEELLLVPGQVRRDRDDPPPIGAGAAAFELADAGVLWRYGSAIASGQAPDTQLAVAPLPALSAGGRTHVPVHGDVWVLSSSASDRQARAAAELLAWLGADEQQGTMHRLTDQFPTSAATPTSRSVRRYWAEVGLLDRAWQLLATHGRAPTGWERVPGASVGIDAVLGAIGDNLADTSAWTPLPAAIESAGAVRDPAAAVGLLRCAYPELEAPRGVDRCPVAP